MLAHSVRRLLQLLGVLLIGKIVVVTFLSYRDYMPPNFEVAFLIGREGYFFQGYQWSFYPHIVAGPLSLIFGTLLVSDWFRQRYSKWHRLLGRVQVACVLLVVAPSGLWMAWYAAMGPVAGIGFALLAITTGATAALGWRAAMQRRFEVHRLWMQRCFVLLCSAVVIRVNGGIGEVAGMESHWFYVQTAWTSWLVPLVVWEAIRLAARRAPIRRGPI